MVLPLIAQAGIQRLYGLYHNDSSCAKDSLVWVVGGVELSE